MYIRFKRQQRGLTLVELMISIVLGLLIMASVIQLFLANKRSYNLIEGNTDIQDSAVMAMLLSKQTLEMSGYMSEYEAVAMISRQNSVVGNLPATDYFDERRYIRLVDNVAFAGLGSADQAKLNIAGGNVKSGSDFVLFRARGHMDGNLVSKCSGTQINADKDTNNLSETLIEYMFYVNTQNEFVCFERQYAMLIDSSTYSYDFLRSGTTYSTVLAKNVYDLQLEAGSLTGTDYTFTSIATTPNYDTLSSVRMHLLMRSRDDVGDIPGQTSLSLLNSTIASTVDGHLYRQFQQSVVLQMEGGIL